MTKKSSSRRYPEAHEKSEAPSRVAESGVAAYSVTKPSALGKSPRSSVKRIDGYTVSKVSGTVEEVLAQMNRFDEEMIQQVPIEKGAKICLSSNPSRHPRIRR